MSPEKDTVFEVRVRNESASRQDDDEAVYSFPDYDAARRTFDGECNRTVGQEVTLYEREVGHIAPGKMLRRMSCYEGRWEDR